MDIYNIYVVWQLKKWRTEGGSEGNHLPGIPVEGEPVAVGNTEWEFKEDLATNQVTAELASFFRSH